MAVDVVLAVEADAADGLLRGGDRENCSRLVLLRMTNPVDGVRARVGLRKALS